MSDELRKQRGEQLRALVVAWRDGREFPEVLEEQTKEIEEGKFALNDDWCVIADQILSQFMSMPRMPDWNGE